MKNISNSINTHPRRFCRYQCEFCFEPINGSSPFHSERNFMEKADRLYAFKEPP